MPAKSVDAVKRVGGFVIFSSMRPRFQATSSFFFMAGNVLAFSSFSSLSSLSSPSSVSCFFFCDWYMTFQPRSRSVRPLAVNVSSL